MAASLSERLAWVTGYVLKINYYNTALIITFTVHLNLKLDSAD
jgi:hypothetical protein